MERELEMDDEREEPQQEDGNPSDTDALQLALEEAQTKAAANWEDLLRAKAEAENQRKRSAREMENVRKFSIQDFVVTLLPVKDSLERGLAVARESSEPGSDALIEGAELTLRMWDNAFTAAGIQEINPLGEEFNPELHEAITVANNPEVKPHTIVHVSQRGYVLNGRVIRPAQVVVAGPL